MTDATGTGSKNICKKSITSGLSKNGSRTSIPINSLVSSNHTNENSTYTTIVNRIIFISSFFLISFSTNYVPNHISVKNIPSALYM